MKFQDWTVGASGGVSHKESINTTEIKEPILKGNHVYAEHYEISPGDTKGERNINRESSHLKLLTQKSVIVTHTLLTEWNS